MRQNSEYSVTAKSDETISFRTKTSAVQVAKPRIKNVHQIFFVK
jgi:hypothetical protein